jgi:hypothetical protein
VAITAGNMIKLKDMLVEVEEKKCILICQCFKQVEVEVIKDSNKRLNFIFMYSFTGYLSMSNWIYYSCNSHLLVFFRGGLIFFFLPPGES